MRQLLSGFLALVITVGVIQRATAAIVAYDFAATVTSVYYVPYGITAPVGSQINGHFSYDTNPLAFNGYNHYLSDGSFSLDFLATGDKVQAVGPVEFDVFLNGFGFEEDGYGPEDLPLLVNGVSQPNFGAGLLLLTTHNVYDFPLVPPETLSLSEFDFNVYGVLAPIPQAAALVYSVTSLTPASSDIASVPEPASSLLWTLLALSAAPFARRRKSSSAGASPA